MTKSENQTTTQRAMHRWERRLSDLAHILSTCSTSYFDPNLFRLNTNQFLTTARTVTFLIQKDKDIIPNFDHWYGQTVLTPWANDTIMTWAKNSRNQIEKQGDLDLYSTLSVRLIYSYFEENDFILDCPRSELLSANVKRLMRFAEKELPSAISDASVLKIQRKWVVNTLPEHELLNVMIYVYAKIKFVAESLAVHLDLKLYETIPEPASFDETATGARRIRYIKFSDRKSSSLVSKVIHSDKQFEAPEWLQTIADNGENRRFNSLKDQVDFAAKMAQSVFEQFGNHLAMLFLLNEEGKIVDMQGIAPVDQATKFIFWRSIGDKIIYLGAASLIWISEQWIRSLSGNRNVPIRKLPIIGEMLQVIGLSNSDEMIKISWDIVRTSDTGKATLSIKSNELDSKESGDIYYYLAPARRAFKEIATLSTRSNQR